LAWTLLLLLVHHWVVGDAAVDELPEDPQIPFSLRRSPALAASGSPRQLAISRRTSRLAVERERGS